MISLKTNIQELKIKAKKLKNEIIALFLAYKRPDVPWYAKVVTIIVVGYALSPIDLIPDFIPILGYLDDLILLPIGISIAIRLIPKHIMEQCRNQANNLFKEGKPKNYFAALIIILIWILIISMLIIKMFF